MIKIVIGIGLVGLAVFAFGSYLQGSEELTEVVKSQAQKQIEKKVASIEYVDDGATASPTLGRMAYIDPETGQLTSEVNEPLDGGASFKATVNLPPVKITTYTDGTVKADLNGRFRTPLMATISCDGGLKTEHSDHPEPAVRDCGVEQ